MLSCACVVPDGLYEIPWFLNLSAHHSHTLTHSLYSLTHSLIRSAHVYNKLAFQFKKK